MHQQTLYQEAPLRAFSLNENTDTFNDFSWDSLYETERHYLHYFSEITDLSLNNLLSQDLLLRKTDHKYQFIDKMFPEIFSLVLVSLLLTMSCVKERFQGFDKNKIAFSSSCFSSKASALKSIF